MTDAYIEEITDDGVVILRFAEYVDQVRRPVDDTHLFDLVDRHEQVICDLSNCVEMVSRWLKLLSLMSDRARDAGKQVVLVGVRESILRSSDWLGVRDDFTLAPTVDEALER
jgi:anti-anti-sigma regulatory factor